MTVSPPPLNVYFVMFDFMAGILNFIFIPPLKCFFAVFV